MSANNSVSRTVITICATHGCHNEAEMNGPYCASCEEDMADARAEAAEARLAREEYDDYHPGFRQGE